MKFINEYTEEYKGSLTTYNVVVTEAATAYYVTLYMLGYENPCLKDFKVRKRKRINYKAAIRWAVSWYENKCAI